jgi:phosphatidylinositol dimannoside acyltransferase
LRAAQTTRRLTAAVQPTEATERAREKLIYHGFRTAERLAGAAPRRAALYAAAAVGNVTFDLAASKRAVVCENVARPLGLPATHPRVRHAARRAFRNYGRYLVDMLRLATMSQKEAERLIRIENPEILARAREMGGGGVVVCTVHVGGMDLIGPGLRRHGERMHVVADDTTYGRLYRHLAAVRARHDVHLIGWRNLRGLYRALRAGENLALFCDRGYRAGDVPVMFMGEPTTLPLGPATLSARIGAPMLPVHVRRTSDDRFIARGLPLIAAPTNEPAAIQRATQDLADALASVISEDPGQWYMFRPIWPQTDADRARARAALELAKDGGDWTRRRLP